MSTGRLEATPSEPTSIRALLERAELDQPALCATLRLSGWAAVHDLLRRLDGSLTIGQRTRLEASEACSEAATAKPLAGPSSEPSAEPLRALMQQALANAAAPAEDA